MSISYCEDCDEYVDWDVDVEHFDQNGKCVLAMVKKLEKEGWHPDAIGDLLFELGLTCDY